MKVLSGTRNSAVRCLLLYHQQTASSKIYKRWKSNVVGFIGLGNMGIPMAKNLLKNGYQLFGYDISANRMEIFRQESHGSAQTGNTLQEVVANTEAVVTMLPECTHVLSAYSVLLESPKKNQVFIDCSTISPDTSKKVAEMVESKGCKFLGAPVSGGVVGAVNGTLTFMVGGDKDTLVAHQCLFNAMGSRTIYCGNHGSGLIAKICNNMILGMSTVAVAEAMNLGIKLGLDPKLFASVINTSSGRCWASEVNNPVPGALENNCPSNNEYKNGFKADLLLKDMNLGKTLANNSHVPIPLTDKTVEMYNALSSKGLGDKDFSVVYKYLKDL
ncbi:3-hydroxyisobutyrate dehydrogenase, mitochondrial-like [Daktulosphaira vitifoliae]|uniref:3-hydroxyisobutyrate dehydrogenase, mitochondrial-like n=1 Tax=Daktulosphaira vitifoliae TaxID=58002 RepID=UPI0021A99D3E|nr:3-hydroxyisobutyrate dehydrogenase, mitochondrial-like [Daktulosphaira vitifoliae]